jgi:FkbM family methyltransferase
MAVELKCFGSEYGHWCFIEHEGLKNSLIISGGVGEDMSFDIDFASEYNATVILYDPTPRSVKHFELVSTNFGKKSTRNYVSGGNQPIESYDLSNLTSENFVYREYALWNENTRVKFFQPTNKNYVSHSITNIQRNYDVEDSNFIEVDSIKLSDEISNLDKFPSILKLDIEGAALEVLEDLFENNIFIDQICIEYDEQNVSGEISNGRIDSMNKLFKKNNYKCIHNNQSDYLFVSKEFFKSLSL